MDSSTGTIVAAFTALTIALSTAFFRLATELARLKGAIDTLVSCVRLLRETADRNSLLIGRLQERSRAQQSGPELPDPDKEEF